jgi:hypothetical protein
MDDRLLEHLLKKLEEIKNLYTAPMSEGAAKDFGEYQNMCGVIRGLTLAQREIADLVRKLKDDDDNDD